MSDPVLRREAEVPLPRTTGAAVGVIIAFGVLFTALAASAFIVRVRMSAHASCSARMQAARAAAEAEAARRDAADLEAELAELSGEADVLARQLGGDGHTMAASGAVPVELISQREARRRAEANLSDSERADVAAFRARASAGQPEVALEIWNGLPPASPARYLLSGERNALADDWLATQLARMDRELARRDCGAVDERLARIVRLLPDRALPHRMADCK